MSEKNVASIEIIETDNSSALRVIENKDINVKNIVTKSNELIEASYKLTTEELKTIELLSSVVEPDDTEFKPYKFKISDYMEVVGIKNKGKYREMQEITKNLMKKVFTIKFQNYVLQTAWLSSAKYIDGEGVVELTFNPNLKPFYLGLKERFTSYKLQNVIRLKSNYSIRIYSVLKQYEKIRERTFELDRLRELVGLDVSEYPLYADFKKRVLVTAQKELKEKTDISFEFIEIKLVRKVAKIKFIINSNTLVPKVSFSESVLERLITFCGFSEEKAKEIINMYEENFIKDTLVRVEKQFNKGNVKDITSYTSTALADNYIKIKQKKKEDNKIIDLTPGEEIKKENRIEEYFLGTQYEIFIEKLKGELTPVSYDTWIKNIYVQKFENNILYLKAEDDFIKGILEARYLMMLKSHAATTGITDIILY